jgi:hypothetical protein
MDAVHHDRRAQRVHAVGDDRQKEHQRPAQKHPRQPAVVVCRSTLLLLRVPWNH